MLAVALALVLAVTVAAPTRAEALEPLTIVAIASLAAAGVILIVYLVIANIHESRREARAELRSVACIQSEGPRTCWEVSAGQGPIAVTASPESG